MAKRKKTATVGRLMKELASEYGRLTAKEAEEKLRSGAALVASRKELHAKRQQRDVASSRRSDRIRVAR